jgi:hypothetical protein
VSWVIAGEYIELTPVQDQVAPPMNQVTATITEILRLGEISICKFTVSNQQEITLNVSHEILASLKLSTGSLVMINLKKEGIHVMPQRDTVGGSRKGVSELLRR